MKKIIKYIKKMFKKDKIHDIPKSDFNIASDGIGSGKNLFINLKRMGYSDEEINEMVYNPLPKSYWEKILLGGEIKDEKDS